APIHIEPRRQHNQVWTALQRHESRHGRAHAELPRFVIARSQNAASLARATHADRFTTQRRAIAHLNGGIKAVHVQMDDCTCVMFAAHMEIWHNATRRPSGVFSCEFEISRFAMTASFRY